MTYSLLDVSFFKTSISFKIDVNASDLAYFEMGANSFMAFLFIEIFYLIFFSLKKKDFQNEIYFLPFSFKSSTSKTIP